MKTLFEIEPAYATALRAAGLTDFDAFMRAPAGPPVGWHRQRETVPLDLSVGGKPRRFFLKRVFGVPPKHAFWPLLVGRLGRSQPYREWHTLIELERSGIPAMKRVAYGERRRFGMPTQAFLLVEAVPMQYTLENWLVPGVPKPPPIEKRLRDHLIFELGLLIWKLKRERFSWPDFHAKHVFAAPAVNPEGRRRWDFCLIDVERMCRTNAYIDGSIDGLSVWLLSRWDALRLLAARYRKTDAPWAPRGADRRLRSPGNLAWQLIGGPPIRLPDDYEYPGSRKLIRHEGMTADARWVPALRAAELAEFEAVFEHGAGQAMGKPGLAPHRDRIRLEVANGSGNRTVVYLKRYRNPPWREQWRRRWEWRAHESTAAREAHYIKKLLRLGIPAPRIVAHGELMQGCTERRSFIITEEIKGRSLEKLVAEWGGDPRSRPAWSERREVIHQLALITRRLHRNELFHRDLYLSHVFLTRNADGGIVLHLIDLARMISRFCCSERWAVKDLAALDYSAPAPFVTRADRLRFLYDYLQALNPTGGRLMEPAARRFRLRDLIKKVRTRVRRMARHDAKRARRFEGAAQA